MYGRMGFNCVLQQLRLRECTLDFGFYNCVSKHNYVHTGQAIAGYNMFLIFALLQLVSNQHSHISIHVAIKTHPTVCKYIAYFACTLMLMQQTTYVYAYVCTNT